MRISDWSSDVCSSDLQVLAGGSSQGLGDRGAGRAGVMDDGAVRRRDGEEPELRIAFRQPRLDRIDADQAIHRYVVAECALDLAERKSVVEGTSVSVRVDLGWRRISKKKKNKNI